MSPTLPITLLTRLQRGLPCWLVVWGAVLYCAPVRADVWGYVDVFGVTHFSAEKLDARYELFFRGNDGFSAGRLKAVRGLGDTKTLKLPPGNGSAYAPPKLLAYFDVSPNYKAVKHLLREAAVKNGIDYELLQALIATESGFNTHAVSPKGAVGLMQLIPPTAERYGVRADKQSPISKKLTDPTTNIKAGSRYLRYLMDMFPGQLELAVAAYNAGEGAVQRAGNKIPNYPETQNYVKTVMQLYGYLKPSGVLADGRRTSSRVRIELAGDPSSGRGSVRPAIATQLPELPSAVYAYEE